jgi:hydrogenase-4 component B
VSDPVPILLVVVLAALLLLGVAGAAMGQRPRQSIGLVGTLLTGFGALLAILGLLTSSSTQLDLPIGPPGMGLHLAVDPLSGWYLLLIFLSGGATLAFVADDGTASSLAGLSAGIAGLGLAVVSADAVGLALGLTVAGGAIWASSERGQARTALLAVVLLAALCLLTAVAMVAPAGAGLRFAAARDLAVDPGSPWFGPTWPGLTWAALGLGIIGAGALAGLPPFHAWLEPAHRAAPPRVAALLSGALVPAAAYALLRVAADLPRSVPPGAALPFLVLGTAAAVLGGRRAVGGRDLDAVIAAGVQRQSGLVAAGIGLVLIGRINDLPGLTALSLAAVLLLSAGQALCGTIVVLASAAVEQAAGSRRLDRLGGLFIRMPVTGIALLAGLFGLAALPPGAGFACLWLLFQSILATPPGDTVIAQLVLVGTAAGVALSGALAAAALVRVFGVAFLGRPRIFRAAGAEDAPKPARAALIGLATLSVLLGLFPGGLLLALANPAIRMLANADLSPHAGVLTLSPSYGAPGYAPLPIGALLALCGGAIVFLRRRESAARRGPAWNDGFAAPRMSPLDDPLTQSAGSGFMPELPPLSVASRLRLNRRWRVPPDTGVRMLLAAIAALLLAVLLARAV